MPSFNCVFCAKPVNQIAPGTKNRNHCPYCLCSMHVDNTIGDRSSSCNGVMKAIGKVFKPDGEEVLIHKCVKCGIVRKNRIAGDDSWELVKNLQELDALDYL